MSSPPAKPIPCVKCSSSRSTGSQLDWKKHVKIDEKYYRPTEVDLLIGDASKAKRELGWAPKVGFHELISDDGRRGPCAERERLEGIRGK